jgi:hypothetical protein
MNKPLTVNLIFACLLPTLSLAQPPGMTEMDEVVAKMQIQEVMYRYALYHNTDRPEAYAELFTEDANFLASSMAKTPSTKWRSRRWTNWLRSASPFTVTIVSDS